MAEKSLDVEFTAPLADASNGTLAAWRVTYTPGEWVVLSGPTSLVVLQPAGADLSPLIERLWAQVLRSSSIFELVREFAALQMDQMPSFAALFWSGDGMRSLVRGEVLVTDLSTGETIADGHGVLTWSEAGLGQVRHLQVHLPADASGDAIRLPLVVGAVRASGLVLDASDRAQVRSPQDSGLSELALTGPLGYAPERRQSPDPASAGEDDVAEDDVVEDDVVEDDRDSADTEPMPSPFSAATDQPLRTQSSAHAARGMRATLKISDGSVLELDEPVRMGRAPSADPQAEIPARLVTVYSPSQDISRTHLEISAEDRQVMVTDLHSTNGTTVLGPHPTSEHQRLPPGTAVPVDVGSVLDLGDGVTVLIDPPRLIDPSP